MNSNNFLLIFLGLLSLSFCFRIDQDLYLSDNLQMTNFTGSKMNSSMVTKFIDLIKKSYSYHRDDIVGNAEYLRVQIEQTYAGNYCSSLIFQKNTTGGHYLNGNGVVAVWTKVLLEKPLWVYVIACNTQNFGSDLVSGTGAGSGVNATKANVINNVIRTFQGKYSGCFGISEIGKDLNHYDGSTWNVICLQKDNDVHGVLNAQNHSYYVPNLYQNLRNFYVLYSFKPQ